MIFNKKFEDITFEDVDALVKNKVSESVVLEYKQELPKKTGKLNSDKIAALLSAFANTQGGIVVVGVKCNRQGEKGIPESICGCTIDDGFDDAIESISLDSITPPLTNLSIRVIDSDSTDMRLMLIGVAESDLCHAVDHNTTVYVRLLSQKRPLSFTTRADLPRQEWLRNRRAKSILFKDRLVERAREHLGEMFGTELSHDAFRLIVRAVPSYPHSPLHRVDEFGSRVSELVSQYSGRYSTLIEGNQLVAASDSMIRARRGPYVEFYYEVNRYGMTMLAFDVKKEGQPEQIYLTPTDVSSHVFEGVSFVLEALDFAGFRGAVELVSHLSGLKDTKLLDEDIGRLASKGTNYGSVPSCSLDDSFSFRKTWQDNLDMTHRKMAYVGEFMLNFLHLYGVVRNHGQILSSIGTRLKYDQQECPDPTAIFGTDPEAIKACIQEH